MLVHNSRLRETNDFERFYIKPVSQQKLAFIAKNLFRGFVNLNVAISHI
jgi:hypothetical protein